MAQRKTHCKRGHPLRGPGANVRLKPDGTLRDCLPCQHQRERERPPEGARRPGDLPTEPIRVLLAAHVRAVGMQAAARSFAERLSLSERQAWRRLYRALRDRTLPVREADELACWLGLHPGAVWPQWWTAA